MADAPDLKSGVPEERGGSSPPSPTKTSGRRCCKKPKVWCNCGGCEDPCVVLLRGLCSGIPICCILFYIIKGNKSTTKERLKHFPLYSEYCKCEKCLITGFIVKIKPCYGTEETKHMCVCLYAHRKDKEKTNITLVS